MADDAIAVGASVPTGWMLPEPRRGRTRADWALLSVLAVLWIACLAAASALGMSAGISAAVASDIGKTWGSIGSPFAIDGARITHVAMTRLVMISVAVLPVLTIEAALCGARDCSIGRLLSNRSTSAVYDWLMFALHLVSLWRLFEIVFSLGGIIVVTGAVARAVSAIASSGWRISTGWVPLDCALAFLVFTLCDYGSHRTLHARLFFPLHRMHHSATEMSVATLWRNNPGAALIEALSRVWPFALFDIPLGIATGVGIGVLAYEHLIHSNIRWDWGWFGRWVLHPPASHWLHHSADPAYFNCNLGTIVLWDRLFGTWVDPRSSVAPLGICGCRHNTGHIPREIVDDLRAFVLGLWQRPIRRTGR
jgi:sterol desaturase/sphingolipid hydroxylase (fatty acid hydroxylase superfamily)